MPAAVQRLRNKLSRELAQSEHDAIIHCEREARRYDHQPPGQVLRAIATDARQLRPRLDAIWGKQPAGVRAGRAVGEAFSGLRHFVLDRFLDAERSYRLTLLGLRHGLDVARLLRHVLVQQQDHPALHVCDELIERRARLLIRAEQRLRWFAEHPTISLRSSRGNVASDADEQRTHARDLEAARTPRTAGAGRRAIASITSPGLPAKEQSRRRQDGRPPGDRRSTGSRVRPSAATTRGAASGRSA